MAINLSKATSVCASIALFTLINTTGAAAQTLSSATQHHLQDSIISSSSSIPTDQKPIKREHGFASERSLFGGGNWSQSKLSLIL